MGYKFTITLNREITEEESGILRAAGCADAAITTVPVPGDEDKTVSQMDFDTEAKPTLAEAIESALEAVKEVPDLSVPSLTVPPQPNGEEPADGKQPATVAGTVVADDSAGSASLSRHRSSPGHRSSAR